jgi:ATP-dependent Clp protease ATP-binding subunit ClpC
MFLGPTGVGKTELTKTLAEFMFDNDKSLVRIDMSEYMEKHSVSKLIGAPPGYLGHDEGGIIEQIRHKPYSVILFDEIEKAHPEVFNILLQALDNGHLTDSKGRKVNLKNTIIILTSNVGSEFIDKMESIGFGGGTEKTKKDKYEEMKKNVEKSLKDHFRPEFLNRLDDIVIFDVLSEEAIKEIVNIQIDQVKKRIEEKGINLKVSVSAMNYLSKEGYDPHYGARPLKRLIQNKILNPLASLIISNGLYTGGNVSVNVKGGEFTFNVKKGKKVSDFKEDDIVEMVV